MAGGPLNTSAARELELYIENDAQLYRSQEQPIQKNLITKMARGIYKHTGAVKLYGYLIENGAKKYAREFSVGSDWHQMFSPATRKHVAERFAQHFEVEAKLGNYDQLLPKKYAGWSGKSGQVANPASIPRGKWVNAQVMVTSSGEIKAKIPASAVKKSRRNPREGIIARHVSLQRVRLDRGGYDKSGRYYGVGSPLFEYYFEDADGQDFSGEFRASDRAEAMSKLKRKYPTVRAWKRNSGRRRR